MFYYENPHLAASHVFLDLRDENSAFHTKATSNLNHNSDANFGNLRQSDFAMEQASWIFEEDNKENDPKHSFFNGKQSHDYGHSGILQMYKNAAHNKKISECKGEDFDTIWKSTSSNNSSPDDNDNDIDFLFPISETASKRLEQLKDSLASDKFFSTTVSIDPNTFEENASLKNFPLDRKDYQCSCSDSNIANLKWCSSVQKWLSLAFINEYDPDFNPKKWSEYIKLMEFFYKSCNNSRKTECHGQLLKDLNRTFQTIFYYRAGGKGYEWTKELLTKFISHPIAQDWGYVQGMNFIAATLLYHCQVDVAFWLFVKMVEKFNIIDNYLPGMPGITYHGEIIDKMVFKHLRTLHNYFHEQAIPVQMYSIELLWSLFCSKIPIDKMPMFYDQFIQKGWSFFYALTIVFLDEIQFDIMEHDDSISEIPNTSITEKSQNLKWKRLISKAVDFEISSR